MAGLALVGALGAELVDVELVALDDGLGDLEGDGCTLDIGGTEFGVAADGADDEYFVDGDFIACFGIASVVEVDEDLLVSGDLALPAGLFDDCVGVCFFVCHVSAPISCRVRLGRTRLLGFRFGPSHSGARSIGGEVGGVDWEMRVCEGETGIQCPAALGSLGLEMRG